MNFKRKSPSHIDSISLIYHFHIWARDRAEVGAGLGLGMKVIVWTKFGNRNQMILA